MIAIISKETLKDKKKREAAGGAPTTKPCIVYWTGKGGLMSINVLTYCDEDLDTSERGVTQVPDRLFNAGLLCDACTASYRQYEAQIPVPAARAGAAARP